MTTNFFFQNRLENKNTLKELIYTTFLDFGQTNSKKLADKIKKLGFEFGTKSGLSLNVEDLKILPSKKNEIDQTKKKLAFIDKEFYKGNITFVSKLEQIINVWNTTSENLKNDLIEYFNSTDPFNSINIMAFSGARGNISQVRQLVGMRGLMSTPSGDLIDVPIIHNFREGLSISDYLMSSYGARKGVVDTALRTADSGYLTRRLVEVAHDFIIREPNCFTKKAIKIELNEKNYKKSIGRCLARDIYSKKNKQLILNQEAFLTSKNLLNLISNNVKEIYVYSSLLCESSRSICQKCYGWDLSRCQKISLGATVGIIAAQSIGEPGTQLTMRTFHTGGIFLSDSSNQIKSEYSGIIKIHPNVNIIKKQLSDGRVINILQNNSEFTLINLKNIKIKFSIPANSYIYFNKNQFVKRNTVIAEALNPLTQTKKITKNIITSSSGELFYNSKANSLELLKGDIFEVHKKLFFDFIKLKNKNFFSKKIKPISFLKTNCLTTLPGVLKYNLLKKKTNFYKFETNFILKFNGTIYLDKEKTKLKGLILKNSPFSYKKIYLNKNFCNSVLMLESYDFKYHIPFDAELAIIKDTIFVDNFILNSNPNIRNIINLVLPRNTIRDKIFKNKEFYLNLIHKFTKIFISNFTTDGKEKNNIFNQLITKIKIKLLLKKPTNEHTTVYFLKKNKLESDLLKTHQNNNQNYRSFIAFKGTRLFKKIILSDVSLCEILVSNKYIICIITKISCYNINLNNLTNKKLQFNLSSSSDTHFSTDVTNKLNFIKKNQFLILKTTKIETSVKSLLQITKQNLLIKIANQKLPVLLLKCTNFEKFPRKIKTAKNEIISYTKLNKLHTFSHLNTKIGIVNVNTRVSFLNKLNFYDNKFLNLNLKYCKNYYTEFPIKKSSKKNKIIFQTNIKFIEIFKVLRLSTFKVVVRETIYYKITTDTTLFKKKGFIYQNAVLGNMNYEKRITGDIIQGLPKIEEILEARQPINSSVLSNVNGIVLNCKKSKNKSELKVLSECGKVETFFLNSKINLKKNEFIFIGKRLNPGNLNLHNLLNIYFHHFKNFIETIHAAKLAFIYTQVIILKKIEEIFENQNIFIADKHIELIVKKITSKVQLENNLNSLALHESIVDLKDVEYINIVLENNKQDLLNYSPILLGITKISLMNKSFITSASFQETHKILKTASIQNRIDWMTEIKSNILIGRTQNFGSLKLKG
jgi:hypothetical protein